MKKKSKKKIGIGVSLVQADNHLLRKFSYLTFSNLNQIGLNFINIHVFKNFANCLYLFEISSSSSSIHHILLLNITCPKSVELHEHY